MLVVTASKVFTLLSRFFWHCSENGISQFAVGFLEFFIVVVGIVVIPTAPIIIGISIVPVVIFISTISSATIVLVAVAVIVVAAVVVGTCLDDAVISIIDHSLSFC